jgi:hypothetical protein
MQRRGGDSVHVRPHPKIDAQLGQGVVQASEGVQQGMSPQSYTGEALLIFVYLTRSSPNHYVSTLPLLLPSIPNTHRRLSHSWSAQNTIAFRPFPETSKRRSQSRQNDSPRRCTPVSSFRAPARASTCKRSSRLYLPRCVGCGIHS